MTSDDMRKTLSADGADEETMRRQLDRLRQIAEQEWPTFGRITERDLSKGYWEVSVPEHITRYAGINTVEGYLIQRIEEIEPQTVPSPIPTQASAPPTPQRPSLRSLGKRLVSRSLVENIVGGLVVAAVVAGAGFLTHLW